MVRIVVLLMTVIVFLLGIIAALASHDYPPFVDVTLAAAVAYCAGMVYLATDCVARAIRDRKPKKPPAQATEDAKQ